MAYSLKTLMLAGTLVALAPAVTYANCSLYCTDAPVYTMPSNPIQLGLNAQLTNLALGNMTSLGTGQFDLKSVLTGAIGAGVSQLTSQMLGQLGGGMLGPLLGGAANQMIGQTLGTSLGAYGLNSGLSSSLLGGGGIQSMLGGSGGLNFGGLVQTALSGAVNGAVQAGVSELLGGIQGGSSSSGGSTSTYSSDYSAGYAAGLSSNSGTATASNNLGGVEVDSTALSQTVTQRQASGFYDGANGISPDPSYMQSDGTYDAVYLCAYQAGVKGTSSTACTG